MVRRDAPQRAEAECWNARSDRINAEGKAISTSLIFTLTRFQEAFQTVKSRSETGWPHVKGRHILQLGTGALNRESTDEVHKMAVQCLADGAKEICDAYSAGDCLPRDFEEFHDPVQVGWR